MSQFPSLFNSTRIPKLVTPSCACVSCRWDQSNTVSPVGKERMFCTKTKKLAILSCWRMETFTHSTASTKTVNLTHILTYISVDTWPRLLGHIIRKSASITYCITERWKSDQTAPTTPRLISSHTCLGNILPASQIMSNLKYIMEDTSPKPSHPLGFLTSENRDVWAGARDRLLANGELNFFRMLFAKTKWSDT